MNEDPNVNVRDLTSFSSLAEIAKLQDGKVIDLFESLFTGSTSQTHSQIISDRS